MAHVLAGAVKLLVTGATGFLGKPVVENLSHRGHDLRAIVRAATASDPKRIEHLRRADAEIVVGSLLDRDVVKRAAVGVGVVCHLAAVLPRPGTTPAELVHSNVVGTANLVDASVRAGVGHFVFASSVSVYPSDAVAITEHMRPAPAGPYGYSKVAGERSLLRAHLSHGLPFSSLRIALVYGPQGPPEVARAIHQILGDGWLPPLHFGRWLEQWIHLRDAADAVVRSVVHDAAVGACNVAGAETVTRPQLTSIVRGVAGRSPRFGVGRSAAWRSPIPLYDIRKAHLALGFVPAISLTEGLHDLVAAAPVVAPRG